MSIRDELSELGTEERYTFRGLFQRYGYKKTGHFNNYGEEFTEPTFLIIRLEVLKNNTWQLISDHIWLNLGKQFLAYGWFELNDTIQFDGRVSSYESKKGKGDKIERPSKVKAFRDTNELLKNKEILEFNKLDLVKNIEKLNKEFYEAREFIMCDMKIPHFNITRDKWSNIKSYLCLDDKLLTEQEFKDTYVSTEDVIRLYSDVREDKLELQTLYYNGEVKKENSVTLNQILENIEKVKHKRKIENEMFNELNKF